MGQIHAFLPVSRDAFFEWSLGWGLWLANDLHEVSTASGNIFISIESG
ncbi:hypothetical protein ACQKNS_10870 [Peribacillus sp. NPDC094092]